MAYSRKGWDDGLTLLDEWWYAVTAYAGAEGCEKLSRYVADFRKRSALLCKFIREVAELDPLTIWELGMLIERREGIVGTRRDGTDMYSHPDPHATISDIINATYRAVPLKDQLFRDGLVSKKAGRPKSSTTLAAERLASKGADANQIAARLNISAENARQILSRTRRKS